MPERKTPSLRDANLMSHRYWFEGKVAWASYLVMDNGAQVYCGTDADAARIFALINAHTNAEHRYAAKSTPENRAEVKQTDASLPDELKAHQHYI